MVLFHLIFLLCMSIQPKIRVLIGLFLFFAQDHSTKIYGRFFHIFFLLCMTIQPRLRVLTDFFFFSHDHSKEMYRPLSYHSFLCLQPFSRNQGPHLFIYFICTQPFDQIIWSSFIYSFFILCMTIRPKIRVLINLFILFVHDHSTKNQGPH